MTGLTLSLRPRPRWACLLALMWMPLGAQAVTEFAVQLDSSWASDSNPSRTASAAASPPPQSDHVMTNELRAALIVPLLSDQTRLEISGALGRRDYRQAQQLSSDVRQLDARLLWQAGTLWRGRVGYSTDERLYQPQNATIVLSDLTRQQQTSSEVALRITPDLELPLNLNRISVRHDNPFNQFLDRNEVSGQLSLRYQSPLGSVLSAGVLRKTVDYPHRTDGDAAILDTRYADQQAFVDVSWVYSPLTTVGARLNRVSRSFSSLSQNDFSLWSGDLRLAYQYSAMTRFDAQWLRAVYDSSTTSALYILDTGLRLGASWQLSPITRFRVTAAHDRQQNVSSQISAGSPVSADAWLNRLGGGLNYTLTRGLDLYVEGLRDTYVQDNGPTIRQNVLRVGLQYSYENLPGVVERGRLVRRP